MNFNTAVLDLMQESIQAWNFKGEKLFCNKQSQSLYELTNRDIHTFEDVISKWTFFDSNDNLLDFSQLPVIIAMTEKKSFPRVELKMVSKNSTKWITQSVNQVFEENGKSIGVLTNSIDITHLKSQENKYKKIANFDALTKLPNRLLLADRLSFGLSQAKRKGNKIAVCMIDLDGFKEINDTLGHEAGDILLVEVANRMKSIVRADDTVARLGGDEFVIVLTDISKIDECAVTLYRILNILSSPYTIHGHKVKSVSASIGVSLSQNNIEADTLLRNADIAMYKSKNSGKNKFSFFDAIADQKVKANFKTLNKIKKAITQGEFCLYYQPKINTFTGKVIELEALARWKHPLLGIISPSEFLPLIENDDELNNSFDEWVIEEGILQLSKWEKEGLYIKLCLNLSPKQLQQKNFATKIENIIAKNSINPELLSYLEFEILESSAVEYIHESNDTISQCKALGISFALDDFGTGHSSFIHLKELAVDTVKIDKSFVIGMLDNSENMAIVQAVTGLASAFDISVTAEGAQTIEQVLSLIEIGCDEIQGYAIARPMPKDEIKEFITTFVPDPRWKVTSQTFPSKIDFELLLAESNHKYWIQKSFEKLDKKEIDEEFFEKTHKECKFGKWFEKITDHNTKESSTLKKLDLLHQQTHDKVHTLYHTLKGEKRTINDEEKKELLEISNKLMFLISSIKKEFEIEKKHISLAKKILNKRKINER